MRKCGAQSWSDNGRLRNLDCAKPSAWRVSSPDEDSVPTGFPCDDHIADFLNWDGRSVVVVYQEDRDG